MSYSTRNSADLSKFEKLIDEKLSAFASTLATRVGLCELKNLFKDLNTKIDKQNEEILNLKESEFSQRLFLL